MAVRAHLVIHGRVQGVWFRGSMQDQAERVGVAGWVRNRPDGSVEAEVEGQRPLVDEVIAWAQHGPQGARVDRVEVAWIAPVGDRGGFAVRR
jgi:acylphosphatase